MRRQDRSALAGELAGEVEAADADGYPPQTLLGADPDTTARGWALERGLAGRSLQAPTMLAVVLTGVLLGISTLVVEVASTWLADGDNLTPAPVIATTLITSAVMAVLLPVLGVWAALHHRGDPRAGASARWLAVLLPLGGMTGALLVVALGTALQNHEAIAWPVMAAAFLGACAASGLLARRIATRYAPIPR